VIVQGGQRRGQGRGTLTHDSAQPPACSGRPARACGHILAVGARWCIGNAIYVFLLRQFFLTIPGESSEAARIDGAGDWRIFWSLIVPLSRPALVSVALFTFLYNNAYTDYLGPLIYLTNAASYTLSLGLEFFKNAFTAEWQLMMAASVMTTGPVIILFFLTQRTFIQGITLSGIKG
jgi:multiple sugar transport system permease protein